jgi:hypothetical protein
MSFTQTIAVQILEGAGPQVIWDLHLAAARAYEAGRADLAQGYVEVADAVEDEWRRRDAGLRPGFLEPR